MEVLSSRILLRPVELTTTQVFYREVLGLAIARQFGSPQHPGIVFYLGNGLLEVSGSRPPETPSSLVLWLQVRDVGEQLARLEEAGARILRAAQTEPWGLIEGWLQDPDGTRIVLVQIPDDHPLRQDQRQL